jgi:hypothetical protein
MVPIQALNHKSQRLPLNLRPLLLLLNLLMTKKLPRNLLPPLKAKKLKKQLPLKKRKNSLLLRKLRRPKMPLLLRLSPKDQ